MTPLSWFLIGAAALLGVLFLIFSGRGKSGLNIETSRAARTAKAGALGSRLSWRYLWAKARALFAGEEKKKKILDETHLKSAEEVVRFMGNMKGAIMKVGQIVSFLSDDVPEQYRAVLKQLQTQSPPMSFDLARGVIEKELGAPLKKLFKDIDEKPLAAASIGQVHRARLPDGKDVVIKVQYPGVDQAIQADLSNLNWMYAMMGMLNPGLDPKPLVQELKERIGEELDYRLEARNQETFVALYGGHPFIRVPKIVPSHSASRVLTQEFVPGKNYDWLLKQPEAFRNQVSEVLYRFVFGSIARFRVFNGDPHPGNYLFHEDGSVTFLDYGCIKYFPEGMLAGWKDLIRAHVEGDKEKFRRQITELKFIRPGSKGTTEQFYDYFGYFYEPFSKDRLFAFTPEYNAKSLGLVFDRNHPEYGALIKELNMPPDFALVNRIQWGVYSIFAQLRASGNWHRIWREYYYDEPPTTKLGKESSAFRAAWKKERGIPPDASVWMEPGGIKWEKKAA